MSDLFTLPYFKNISLVQKVHVSVSERSGKVVLLGGGRAGQSVEIQAL